MPEHIKNDSLDVQLAAWRKFLEPSEVLVHPDDMPLLEAAGVAEGAIPCKFVARGTIVTLKGRS